MTHFSCSIYNYDIFALDVDIFGLDGLDVDVKRLYHAPVVHVCTTNVFALSDQHAAAKGHCRTVGKKRCRLLKKIKAPLHCWKFESNHRALAKILKKTTLLLGDCFTWNNMVEAWFIFVNPIRIMPRSRSRRPLSARKRRFLRWARLAVSNN